MAVIKQNEDGDIKITNGDLAALKAIAAQYGLPSEAEALVFAIGILSQAKGKAVSIEREDGSVIKLIPSEKLRNQTP